MSSARKLLSSGFLMVAALAATSVGAQERTSPPRPGGGGSPLPSGSYLNSCRGANLNGNMLSAQCPGPTGAPVFSTIDTNSCRGRDIANDRGYLRCNSGGPQPPRPPGPVPPRPLPPGPPGQGLQAVAYTQPNFRGASLPIRGPITNMANYRGFNDTIRSIQIFRGRLEVCSDARYRGRCVTLRRSEANLASVGMANQISSIR